MTPSPRWMFLPSIHAPGRMIALAIAILFGPLVAVAQPGERIPEATVLQDLYGEWGPLTTGLAVEGDRAFVISTGEITGISLADPTHLRETGHLYDYRTVLAAFTSPDYLFTASDDRVFSAWDIADPFFAARTDHIYLDVDEPGAELIAAVGVDGLAAVTSGGVGVPRRLHLVNITDPANLVIHSSTDLPPFSHVADLANGMALVLVDGRTSGLSRLELWDVSDPGTPAQTGALQLAGYSAVAVTVRGTTAALLTHQHIDNPDNITTLHLVDISDPAMPALINSCQWAGSGRAIVWHGSRAYISDRYSGLVTVNLDAPNDPAVLSIQEDLGPAVDLALYGEDYVVLADPGNRLRLVDIRQVTHPAMKSDLQPIQELNGLVTSGSTAAICDERSIRLLDLADPERPREVSCMPVSGQPHDLAFRDQVLYVTLATEGIMTVDVSDPHHPEPLDTLALPPLVRELVLDGLVAWVASESAGVLGVDISDPLNLQLHASLSGPIGAMLLQVHEKSLYTSNGVDGVQVIDVSDSQQPVLLASINDMMGDYPSNEIRDLAISGDRLFMAGQGLTSYSLDISDPAAPELTDVYWDDWISYALDIRSHQLALFRGGGLSLYDISAPDNPVRTNTAMLGTTTEPRDIVWREDLSQLQLINRKQLIVVSVAWTGVGDDGGSTLLQPNGIQLQPVYPNPFNGTATIPFILTRQGEVQVSLLNVLGKVVWAAPPVAMSAGTQRLPLDASGLASGTYLLRVTLDHTPMDVRRITLVR